jgi:branched-chain amino acid transport system substrate-binding protein
MSAITAKSALALTTAILLAATLSACVADDAGGANAGGNTEKDDLQCGLATGEPATGESIEVGAVATASGGVDFSSDRLLLPG